VVFGLIYKTISPFPPGTRLAVSLHDSGANEQDLSLGRHRHPRAGEGELRRRLAGLLLGEELARKVCGELEA